MPPAPSVATPQRVDPQRQQVQQDAGPRGEQDFPGADHDTDWYPDQRPQPDQRQDDRDPDDVLAAALTPRRRGRKPIVITLVLLLLAGLAGGTLALPDVANSLALPWAPNAPKAPPPEPLAVQRSLVGPQQADAAPTPGGISDVLARVANNPALGKLSGSVVDPVSGKVLWQRNADKPLPPASTTKLLTASAALLSIDHTATLTTKVVRGPTPGSVVLVAGGDPTLSSAGKGEDSFYADAARLTDLVKQVRKAAGDVSTVYLDADAYQGATRAPGWVPVDAPSTYAAPIEPGMLDGGRIDPSYDESMRIGDPAGALVTTFAQRLGAKVGGPAPGGNGGAVLGRVESAPLTTLVDDLLTNSDNVLAEAMARQVALATGKPPSFAGGAAATEQVLRQAGFDLSGVTLDDGSGLSLKNAIPASLLSDILATAAGDTTDPTSAKLRPLLTGLPVAGGTGTLDDRYLGSGAPGKGWVRAKTGTLSGVNTLAGVVLTKSDRVLVFSLMSSGTGSTAARPALDSIASALRQCGCR